MLATIPLRTPEQERPDLDISGPSICRYHYGNKKPKSPNWIQVGEETDASGNITPIYTECRPA